MIEFDNQLTISEIVSKSKPTVIIYHAKWCMPCKSILQSMTDLHVHLGNDVQIITVNVDEFPIVSLEQTVRAVPTVQYYKEGALYLKESGFRTKDQLKRNMEALLTIKSIEG
jgi:thioredoxin 1